MLLVGLAAFYFGYGVFYYGIEYALGNPVTLGDAILPWRLATLKADLGFLPANAKPRSTGGGITSPNDSTPAPGQPGATTQAVTVPTGPTGPAVSEGFQAPFSA